MLDKLKSLVFGFDEFEKAKIDERFNQILLILPEIQINELRDFEILETVIFKIKELLRVKSSNLNGIIKNPKKKLNKKQVLEIIEKLDNLKYNFLKKAFSAIEKEKLSSNFDLKIDSKEDKNEIMSSLNIFEDNKVKVILENGKIPYLFLDFKEKIDFVLIKNFSIYLFDIYQAQGTNILSEENRVLIIPRFNNDELFFMPKVEVNLDEVYQILVENLGEKVEDKEVQNNIKDAEFVEVKEEQVKTPITNRKNDDSLDSLLFNTKEKDTKFTKKPEPEKDSSKIEVEKDDPIEVKIDKSKEVEEQLIYDETKKKVDEVKEEKKVEMKEEKVQGDGAQEKKDNLISMNSQEFEIFRDDKIVVYLKGNSKILGELIIENIYQKKLLELEDNVLTYCLMFSKVFGATLFEILKAQGTNIIYDFNDSKIRVIPRYQNDELSLNWDLKQATDEELEDIKKRLMKAMAAALNPSNETQTEIKEEKVPEKSQNSDLKKKAEHILHSLTRIP